MTLIRAVVALLIKIFAADLWLTLTAIAAVALSGLGLQNHILSPAALPWCLTAGVLAALIIGVARGSKRQK